MTCTHEHSLDMYIILAYGGLAYVSMRQKPVWHRYVAQVFLMDLMSNGIGSNTSTVLPMNVTSLLRQKVFITCFTGCRAPLDGAICAKE